MPYALKIGTGTGGHRRYDLEQVIQWLKARETGDEDAD
jgi:hypothetical protein